MTIGLKISGLYGGYGPVTVLRNVELEVVPGKASVLLGVNGAGKTSTLRAISGLIRRSGSIVYGDQDISAWPAEKIAQAGIGHVPQGRGTFRDLSVADNLAVGGVLLRDKSERRRNLDMVLELFPRLKERQTQAAGSLSGGEQQMLAIARALMASPKLLLLDEPSLGLSPQLTGEIFGALSRLNRERALTMLIVEQNAALSLGIADSAYVLEAGSIMTSGSAQAIVNDDEIRRIYLGM
ncbi:ABC transporter ATP-binding protein [Pusillimonas caeni]|uniref:ABC transporter ATP-binding protein n=1 Tax=Pusillimonas caeni TaxID=1348472 RepID=UPI000E59FA20|nr:ABC transporter ATP-binding protein [Pusillimonas caeni]TFL13196.1 ABC transporter ATP-binding protein [Pusillimonas caeni]